MADVSVARAVDHGDAPGSLAVAVVVHQAVPYPAPRPVLAQDLDVIG